MGSVTTYLHPLFFLVFCSIPLAWLCYFVFLPFTKFIFLFSRSTQLLVSYMNFFESGFDYFVLICILELDWVSMYWFYLLCVFVCVWLEICVRIILIMFSLHLYVKFFLYVKSYVLSSGVRYRYIVMLCSRVIFGGFVREHVNFWSDE